jgi:topoisomerase IA-like protein
MSDPGRYIELLLESFAELERALIPQRSTRKKTTSKKTTRKKTAKTKPAAKKAAGKSVGKRKRARSG